MRCPVLFILPLLLLLPVDLLIWFLVFPSHTKLNKLDDFSPLLRLVLLMQSFRRNRTEAKTGLPTGRGHRRAPLRPIVSEKINCTAPVMPAKPALFCIPPTKPPRVPCPAGGNLLKNGDHLGSAERGFKFSFRLHLVMVNHLRYHHRAAAASAQHSIGRARDNKRRLLLVVTASTRRRGGRLQRSSRK